MVVFQASLQRRQGFLFRVVDIANELFAMAASVSLAHTMAATRHPNAREAGDLADLFCRNSRRRVRQLFRELWSNDDKYKYKVARAVLAGDHTWMEDLGVSEGAATTPGGNGSATGAGAHGDAGESGDESLHEAGAA